MTPNVSRLKCDKIQKTTIAFSSNSAMTYASFDKYRFMSFTKVLTS